MKFLQNLSLTIITTLLVIVFPFIIATLVTSKTSVFFDIRSFVVLTGSMQPLFPVGSMVYSQKQSGYNVGDIITFSNAANQNVTHRIIAKDSAKGEITYITKGDANNTPDTSPVPANKVIGKTFFFVPYLGLLVNYLKSPLWFIGLIIIPTIIFIGIELWAIKNEIVRVTEKRILEKISNEAI